MFSLAQKQKNTIQLFNQLKLLQPVRDTNLCLVKGIEQSIEEISNYKVENRQADSISNYIICICSNPDDSSLQERFRLLWERLEEDAIFLDINIVFITIGETHNEEFKTIKKLVNFNDNTIFLNIPEGVKDEKITLKIKSEVTERASNKDPDKSLELIQILMANISSIKTMDENLIYETF